jgi:hypothetical protein
MDTVEFCPLHRALDDSERGNGTNRRDRKEQAGRMATSHSVAATVAQAASTAIVYSFGLEAA